MTHNDKIIRYFAKKKHAYTAIQQAYKNRLKEILNHPKYYKHELGQDAIHKTNKSSIFSEKITWAEEVSITEVRWHKDYFLANKEEIVLE